MENDAYRLVCQALDERCRHTHNACMSSLGLFISGSDTEIGKTHVGSQLVASLHQGGHTISPRKPIESGCEIVDQQLIPADATAYYHAVEQSIELDTINPFRFKAALSPPRAARMEETSVSINELVNACNDASGFTVVEGAGGLMSPIAEDGLNIDLAKALGLPLLLVTEDRLGAINQAMMMINCAEYADLSIAAVYLNNRGHAVGDNASDLQGLCSYPIFTSMETLTAKIATVFD